MSSQAEKVEPCRHQGNLTLLHRAESTPSENSSREPPKTIFGEAEKLVLASPLLLIPFTAANFYFHEGFTSDAYTWNKMAAKMFLLGETHVVLTLLLLALPELRHWRERHFRYPTLSLFTIPLLVASFWFVLKFLAPWLLVEYSIPAIVLLNAFAFRHQLAQTFGITLLYNRHGERISSSESEQDTTRLKSLERQERNFYQTMMWLVLVAFCLHQKQFSPALKPLRMWVAALAYVPALGILKISWQHPRHALFNKFLYSLRILLYPIAAVSGFGILCTNALHGIEYTALSKKIVDRSQTPNRKLFFVSGLGMLILFLGVLSLQFYPLSEWTRSRIPLELPEEADISFWLAAFSYLHYVLDGFVFRMKDSDTRELVGPLLIPR